MIRGVLVEFKDRLSALLESNGITAYQLSKETGLSNSLISSWRTGKSTPTVDKAAVVARYFGVSTDYLLGLTDNPDPITMVAASKADNPFGELSDEELAALEAFLDAFRKNRQ